MKLGKSKAASSGASVTLPGTTVIDPAPAPVPSPVLVDDLNADSSLMDDAPADPDLQDLEDSDVDLEDPATDPPAENDEAPTAPIASSPADEPLTSVAQRAAHDAVQRVLAEQAESRLFDVVDTNRVVVSLQSDDLAILKSQWLERNSAGIGKIPFSEFLSNRLRACRSHTAVRAIYVRDAQRQSLEELFREVVMSDDDLVNKVDRHIRPIIECPGSDIGVLKLRPLDPFIMELVPPWYPDMSTTDAISYFIDEAVKEKAGLA
jgi:hypothetical protein